MSGLRANLESCFSQLTYLVKKSCKHKHLQQHLFLLDPLSYSSHHRSSDWLFPVLVVLPEVCDIVITSTPFAVQVQMHNIAMWQYRMCRRAEKYWRIFQVDCISTKPTTTVPIECVRSSPVLWKLIDWLVPAQNGFSLTNPDRSVTFLLGKDRWTAGWQNEWRDTNGFCH